MSYQTLQRLYHASVITIRTKEETPVMSAGRVHDSYVILDENHFQIQYRKYNNGYLGFVYGDYLPWSITTQQSLQTQILLQL